MRAATIDDAPEIQAIYAPYVTDTVISFELSPPSVEEMAARIQKNRAKYPWLVYVAGGIAGDKSGEADGAEKCPSTMARSTMARSTMARSTMAGYAYASAHRERAAYQWSVDVSVYVHPHFQRRSIGRGLYTALFDLLRAQGFVNAYAGIALPNAASVGIHEALGFAPVGIYREVGYKLGRWHDVGWWGLRLVEPAAEALPPRPISDFVDTPTWSSALQHGLALIP